MAKTSSSSSESSESDSVDEKPASAVKATTSANTKRSHASDSSSSDSAKPPAKKLPETPTKTVTPAKTAAASSSSDSSDSSDDEKPEGKTPASVKGTRKAIAAKRPASSSSDSSSSDDEHPIKAKVPINKTNPAKKAESSSSGTSDSDADSESSDSETNTKNKKVLTLKASTTKSAKSYNNVAHVVKPTAAKVTPAKSTKKGSSSSSSDSSSQDEAPKKAKVAKPTPAKSTPAKATKKDSSSSSSDSSSEDEAPKKATPAKPTPAKATSAKATKKDSSSSSSDSSSEDEAPKKDIVAKPTPAKSTPAKATKKDSSSSSSDSSSEDEAPKKATPAKPTPAKATSAKATKKDSSSSSSDSSSEDEDPKKATPAKPTPAKSTPAKATKKDSSSSSSDSSSEDEAPKKATPAKPTPAKSTSAKATKKDSSSSSSDSSSEDEAPKKATPAKPTPAKATSAKATKKDSSSSSSDSSSEDEAPKKATPAKSTPAKSTPAKATKKDSSSSSSEDENSKKATTQWKAVTPETAITSTTKKLAPKSKAVMPILKSQSVKKKNKSVSSSSESSSEDDSSQNATTAEKPKMNSSKQISRPQIKITSKDSSSSEESNSESEMIKKQKTVNRSATRVVKSVQQSDSSSDSDSSDSDSGRDSKPSKSASNSKTNTLVIHKKDIIYVSDSSDSNITPVAGKTMKNNRDNGPATSTPYPKVNGDASESSEDSGLGTTSLTTKEKKGRALASSQKGTLAKRARLSSPEKQVTREPHEGHPNGIIREHTDDHGDPNSDSEDFYDDFDRRRLENIRLNAEFLHQFGILEAKKTLQSSQKKVQKPSQRGLKREKAVREILPRRFSMRLQNKDPESVNLPPEALIRRAAYTPYIPEERLFALKDNCFVWKFVQEPETSVLDRFAEKSSDDDDDDDDDEEDDSEDESEEEAPKPVKPGQKRKADAVKSAPAKSAKLTELQQKPQPTARPVKPGQKRKADAVKSAPAPAKLTELQQKPQPTVKAGEKRKAEPMSPTKGKQPKVTQQTTQNGLPLWSLRMRRLWRRTTNDYPRPRLRTCMELFVDYMGSKSKRQIQQPKKEANFEYDPLKLYISGLGMNVIKADIQNVYPAAVRIEIPTQKDKHTLLGYAFVHFTTEQQMKDAFQKKTDSNWIVMYGKKSVKTQGPEGIRGVGHPAGVQSPSMPGVYGAQKGPQPSPVAMPSPHIQPSPKSQPSPRTPGEQQLGQQPSPFSQQSVHSPFSPSTSAPHSRTQSPFAMPGSTAATQLLPQGSPAAYNPANTPPMGFPGPMQRSPRGTITPTNQYGQGPYNQQQFSPGGPPRGMLGPTPAAMPYGQPGRFPGPQEGLRLPTTLTSAPQLSPGMPGQPSTPGQEMVSPGIRQMHPGMRLERPPFTGVPGGPQPLSPGQQAAMYAGMQVRAGPPGQPRTPGQQMPVFMAPQRTIGVRVPGTQTAPGTMTAAEQGRLSLLEEHILLIQDLHEQEKQEQMKRQVEQRVMFQRREAGVGPEGMPVGPRPGMPMMPAGPGMVPGIEGPMRHLFVQPDMPGMRPRMPGQLSPRTPGACGTPPSPFGMPPGSIPIPKPPTPGDTGPEAERERLQYEHWLMKHGDFLEMQVKFLEQQIQKQKRTKKAINARNRQAKKNGQEMPPQDVVELDRASNELSMLQKQLDHMRKQNRQHQMVIQEYRQKQIPPQGQPSPGVGPPVSGPPPTNMPTSVPMQPPGPRIPGMVGSARLTATARQEYDQYMQNRLRMMSAGGPGQVMGPRMPVPPGPRLLGQQTVLGDNNPFSEDFQAREQMEKFREVTTKDGVPEPPAERPLPPFGDARFPTPCQHPPDQPPRFPGPGPVEGQPWMPRFMFDPATGQRIPGPTDPRFQGPLPPGLGQPPGPAQNFPPTETVTISSDEEDSADTVPRQTPGRATPTTAADSGSQGSNGDCPESPLIPVIPITNRVVAERRDKMEDEKGVATRGKRERSPSPIEITLNSRAVRVGSLRGVSIEPVLVSKDGLHFFIECENGSYRFHVYPQEIQQCLAKFDSSTSYIFLLTSPGCGVRTRKDLGMVAHMDPKLPPPEPFFNPWSRDMRHHMITVILDSVEESVKNNFVKIIDQFKMWGHLMDASFYMELSKEEADEILKRSSKPTTVSQDSGTPVVSDHQYSVQTEEVRNGSRSPSPPKIGFAGPNINPSDDDGSDDDEDVESKVDIKKKSAVKMWFEKVHFQ